MLLLHNICLLNNDTVDVDNDVNDADVPTEAVGSRFGDVSAQERQQAVTKRLQITDLLLSYNQ